MPQGGTWISTIPRVRPPALARSSDTPDSLVPDDILHLERARIYPHPFSEHVSVNFVLAGRPKCEGSRKNIDGVAEAVIRSTGAHSSLIVDGELAMVARLNQIDYENGAGRPTSSTVGF